MYCLFCTQETRFIDQLIAILHKNIPGQVDTLYEPSRGVEGDVSICSHSSACVLPNLFDIM